MVLVGGGDAFERRGWGREHTHRESDGSSAGCTGDHLGDDTSGCVCDGVPEKGDWRHEGPWGLLALSNW